MSATPLSLVRQRIENAARNAGRAPDSIRLLAVSKTHPAATIAAMAAQGQKSFGESYLQEAEEKITQLAALHLDWHFIGRLQGNKTRAIAERFGWLHSLCDARHAERLHRQRPAELPPLQTLIQVNISGEASKAGAEPEQVEELIETCANLQRLAVVGLMALPAPSQESDEQRCAFRRLRELRDSLRRPGLPLPELSMGMSADLEAAIEEGSTWVRVGTALFGARANQAPRKR
jgi:pyridoxal phosphate enzyme (YggS family)